MRKSLIARLSPINLEEERDLFFASNESYNPIFAYAESEEFVASLSLHLPPVDLRFVREAMNILERAKLSAEKKGNSVKIDAGEFKKKITQYLRLLRLEELVKVEVASPSLSVSVASVARSRTHQGTSAKVFISPFPVSACIVESVCAHEIATHLLRLLNDEHQVWAGGNRAAFKLKSHLNTEEGLACINGLLADESPCPLLYSAALRYMGAVVACKSDFVTLFKEMSKYVSDKEECFRFCVRAKRGVVNTEVPKAFGLDQSYLVGAVDILRNVHSTDFVALYSGLIDREDSQRLGNLLRLDVIRLPPFLSTAKALQAYKLRLVKIANANDIAVLSVRRGPSVKSLKKLTTVLKPHETC